MSQEPSRHAELAWSAEQRCPQAPQLRSSLSAGSPAAALATLPFQPPPAPHAVQVNTAAAQTPASDANRILLMLEPPELAAGEPPSVRWSRCRLAARLPPSGTGSRPASPQ